MICCCMLSLLLFIWFQNPCNHSFLPVLETKKRLCKALFEYVPQNEDELELKMGDIVEITEEVS